jgi:hypothetical protein
MGKAKLSKRDLKLGFLSVLIYDLIFASLNISNYAN